MHNFLKTLLLSGSAAALAAGAAMAQEASLEVETVSSSVSRIDLKGFEAPTPVTVVGIEQINRDARVNIGDQIRDLPQVRGGLSLQNGSSTGRIAQLNAGVDSISIRGLGASRNLVLFDRQRVVPAALLEEAVGGSTVDLALIPSGLTQRVDVVTGGASAAWGSDAVTGVVNIVINKNFEGFKGNVTYADSTEVSQPIYKLSLAWGTSFLGGKGHTVFGYDYTQSSDPVFNGEVARAHGDNGRGFVYNPAYCNAVSYSGAATTGGRCSSINAGQPLLVYAYGLGSSTVVQGGLARANTAGVAGSGLTANALNNTMFVGPDATPTSFQTGTVYNATSCYNGCTNDQFSAGGWGANNPYHSAVYFSYTSFQVMPDIKASVQLNYSRLSLRAAGAGVNGNNRVIYADNPYLPDSIAQRFVCSGPASGSCVNTLSNGYNPYTQQYQAGTLTVAQRQARPSQTLTASFDFSANRPTSSASGTSSVDSVNYSWDQKCNAIGEACSDYHKSLMRGVFTLDGTIGDSWTWTSYIQWGQTRVDVHSATPLNLRFNNALDAVRVTSGNVGTSGLPIGSIQCRGLLNAALATAAPTAGAAYGITTATELAGCVPINPFGNNPASNATKNYVTPGRNVEKTGSELLLEMRINQAAAAFSMSGVLPWLLPAGEVGVAYGGEWRLDQACICGIDPRSRLGMYTSGNLTNNMFAKSHVEEGFLEVAIPVLKNDIVQSLNIDLAGRLTHYSFSGLVETWKIGVQSQIDDQFRFRATWSYDIRAPGLWDLFAPGGLATLTAPSFVPGPTGSNGGAPNSAQQINGGNPNLVPEKANTLAAGIVFTPGFIPGLTASVDWYQIHLHGAISSVLLASKIARCQAGESIWCSQIVFERQGSFMAAQGCGAAGVGNFCQGADTTSQIMYVYNSPLNAALMTTAGFDFSVAYGFDLFTGQMDVNFNGNYVYDYSRTLEGITFQGAGGTASYYNGGPKFQGILSGDYREGPWSFGASFRITGDSLMDLGNQGNPAIAQQGVTYTRQGGVDIAAVGAGQRNLLWGAETNYNAIVVRTDLRLQYRWSNNITLFGAIDNVQDLPTAGGILRRAYRAGIRWNY